MRIPDSLYSLVDHGIIEEVVRPLMSGKEAQVYLVVSGGEQRVAKIYKEAQNRTFQNRADYTEGRKVRNSRDQRAMSKGSRHGRAQNEAAWRSTEVDMIYRLRQAGVRVPVPHHFIDGVLIMELVTDDEGYPAPRLGDLTWEPEDAIKVYEQLLGEVVRMLSVGVVHGDLSDFNVLMAADGPVIIDFPQSVDASSNQNARKLLLRDVANLHRFVGKFAPEQPLLPYAEEMWELYKRNALTPDTRLTGRYRAAHKPASTDAVMGLIEDAARDERRRREQRGMSMRGAARDLGSGARGGERHAASPQHAQHGRGSDVRGEQRGHATPAPQPGSRREPRPAQQQRPPHERGEQRWQQRGAPREQRGEGRTPPQHDRRDDTQAPRQRVQPSQGGPSPRASRFERAPAERGRERQGGEARADVRPSREQRGAGQPRPGQARPEQASAEQARPEQAGRDTQHGRGAAPARDPRQQRADPHGGRGERRGPTQAAAGERRELAPNDQPRDGSLRHAHAHDEQRARGRGGESRQPAQTRAAQPESLGGHGSRHEAGRFERAREHAGQRGAQSARAPLPDSALGSFTERPPSAFGERMARGRESSAPDERASRQRADHDARNASSSQRSSGRPSHATRREPGDS